MVHGGGLAVWGLLIRRHPKLTEHRAMIHVVACHVLSPSRDPLPGYCTPSVSLSCGGDHGRMSRSAGTSVTSRGPWPGASRRRVPRPDLPVGGQVFMEWSAVRWLPGRSPPPRGGQPRRLGTGSGLIPAEAGAVWLGAAECVAAGSGPAPVHWRS